MTYDRIAVPKPKTGIFGIGLAAYWAQFPGLRERLTGYQEEIEQNLRDTGSQVVSAGLVDTQPAALEARALFSREDVDLVICYIGTYATSSQVVPAVQQLRCPILLLNLQPVPPLDYERRDTGAWLAN
jgi:L-arabinose isomerase